MSDPPESGKARASFKLRISIGMIAAVALVLGPHSAFAQHGGGGHGGGGGSHGGGGGGHASGGSPGGHAGGSGGAAKGGAAKGPSNGSAATGGISAGSHSTGGQRFVGGNVGWQAPPNARAGGGSGFATFPSALFAGHNSTALVPLGVNFGRQGTVWGSRVFPLPPRIFVPPRSRGFNGFVFFGGGCFGGFFPGLCGSAFWWGPAWAWGPRCDPDWGCEGLGSLNYEASGAYDSQGMGDARLQEFGPFALRAWPREDSNPEAGATSGTTEQVAVVSRPTVTIYLKDGSSYGVTDYWLFDGNLRYVTTYGGENSIPVEQLDLQQTVDENAAHGVNFTLYNEPLRKR